MKPADARYLWWWNNDRANGSTEFNDTVVKEKMYQATSDRFDEKLFWENVEKLEPGAKKWFLEENKGTVIPRQAYRTPGYGTFNGKVRSTYLDGGNASVMYLHSGFNELQAAEAFVKELNNGTFGTSYRQRKIGDSSVDLAEQFKANAEWRDWAVKEAAKAGVTGANLVMSFYSLKLSGINWVLTAKHVHGVYQGDENLSWMDALLVLPVLPYAAKTAVIVKDASGKVIKRFGSVKEATDYAKAAKMAGKMGKKRPPHLPEVENRIAAYKDAWLQTMQAEDITDLVKEIEKYKGPTNQRYIVRIDASRGVMEAESSGRYIMLPSTTRKWVVLEEWYHSRQATEGFLKEEVEAILRTLPKKKEVPGSKAAYPFKINRLDPAKEIAAKEYILKNNADVLNEADRVFLKNQIKTLREWGTLYGY